MRLATKLMIYSSQELLHNTDCSKVEMEQHCFISMHAITLPLAPCLASYTPHHLAPDLRPPNDNILVEVHNEAINWLPVTGKTQR
jgi:hypothetical protein